MSRKSGESGNFMKREYSYVELTYLVNEWIPWIGARIARVTVAGDEISFELYKTGQGKTHLTIAPPLAWMGDYRVTPLQKQPPFGAQLRNLLEGKRIEDIRLVKGERIILVESGECTIVIQLYGKGNLVIMEKDVVIGALHRGRISGLAVVISQKLNIQEKEDPRNCRVPVMAIETLTAIGLGKTYAKEALLDKTRAAVSALFTRPVHPRVVLDGETVIDVTPYALHQYTKYYCQEFKHYNEAINHVMKNKSTLITTERDLQQFMARNKRLMTMIAAQELNLTEQKKEAEAKQQLGEIIYENYTVIKEIIDTIKEARKKHSWNEIRDRLKNHPIIRDIDEKNGKLILELRHS
ncbi:NFACT family protein [Candidatus Woesearchaeota archaeon]|nr:NFACT family protein [Candidatus Woesearchaeota archaeon]